MTLIDADSLGITLDQIASCLFAGKVASEEEKAQAARWIASRQGVKGSYAQMFAPTEKDYRDGVRVFTGEWVRSGAATGHIMGEEACRALLQLRIDEPVVVQALQNAQSGIQLCWEKANLEQHGRFCCGTCTVAVWRHLSASQFEKKEAWFSAGLTDLKSSRLGDGNWRFFPFYYTVLALLEIDLPAVVEELRYAAPALERRLKRKKEDHLYANRRAMALEQALARI